MAFFKHCLICTSLDRCFLLNRNRPEQPLHLNCDCKKLNISFEIVKSKSIATFNSVKLYQYIFDGIDNSKGKQALFNSWGFTANDIDYLKDSFESQAIKNYINGNYKLKKLDEYGQRLAIPINLDGHEFYSCWMLYPEGKIRNVTPFGGWIK